MSQSTLTQLTTVGANVRWVHQSDQTGMQTPPPIHAEAVDASPDFVQRPPPSATPQVLEGLLDYQYGIPAPDANTEALACMPSGSIQRPSPSITPLIVEWLQENMDMAAAPAPQVNVETLADSASNWVPQPRSFATLEATSNSEAEKRSAPRDAGSGRDAVCMPPPTKFPRQETDASNGNTKVTDNMLRQWAALGPAGLKTVGGREGLAKRDNVTVAALKNYLRADGTLTPRGEDRLDPGRKARVTDDMLRQWAALGLDGINAAGGVNELARRNKVSAVALRAYLRADGSLTRYGERRLNPGEEVAITDDMVQRRAAPGSAGIEAAGGVDGLARRNNVSVRAPRRFLHADGVPSQHGQDRLTPGGKAEITDGMLRQWAALGRAGIKAAGGIEGLAAQKNVSAGALRNYLRTNGTLTPYGEDKLSPGGKVEITDDMLRQWATLGRAGIQRAGGLKGLSRGYNVSMVSLRTYLRADGSLTQRGEDRLNPGGKMGISVAMLREWATLGPAGIKAAGGIDGLARQNHVSAVALRAYLRANGSLTVRGKERLCKDM
ncbi:hypothetical protein [Pandoraea pulmonicola]|nr:hypothetical protein [Pandoraea pulmonicola]